MKSFISLLAVPALFISAIAAPTAATVDTIEKRQTAEAYSIVSDLYTTVQQYTGAISTSLSASCSSSIL